jgi:hypothetical protein
MSSDGLGHGSPGLASNRRAGCEHESRREALLALLLALGVVAVAWIPCLALPLTGEDYVLLNRDRAGEPLSPHVFRPLSDAWLSAVHRLFGAASPLPFHAGSLAWHLANAAVWFAIARRCLGSAWSAAAVAGAMGLGLACLDTLAWSPALNRLLSGFGGAIALLALLGFDARPWRSVAFVAGGLAFELGASEDGYGTALLLLAGLAWFLVRGPHRKPAMLGIAACVGLLLVHYAAARSFTDRSPREVLELGGALESADTRLRQVVSGLGLARGVAWASVLAGALALALSRARGAAVLGLAACITSFVPFCFSTPWPYRAYATQGPVAFLLAGGFCTAVAALAALVSRSAAGRRWATRAACAVVLGWCFLGTAAARRGAFQSWEHGLAELSTVVVAAREEAVAGAKAPPPLVNLQRSAQQAFAYFLGSDPRETRKIEFLDAPTGFEEPGRLHPGPWYGRRSDGTYGALEGERYFAGRPRLEPLRLFTRARPVGSLEEARALLASGSVDVMLEALVQAPPEALRGLDGGEGGAPELEVVEPFRFQGREGGLVVRVRSDRPTVLAYLEHWLFESERVMPSEDLYIHRRNDARSAAMTARDRASGESLATYFVDGFGLGTVVPAGERVLELGFAVQDYGRELDTR